MSWTEWAAAALAAAMTAAFLLRPSLLRGIFAASVLGAAGIVVFASVPVWVGILCLVGFVILAAVAAVGVLAAICRTVDLDQPQEQDSPFFRWLMHVCIEALVPIFRLEIRTEGLEKTPKEGRFLLVCNHQNESDPGIVLRYFKKSQLAFISKKENRDMFVVGKIMHKTLCQLVNRENDREALKTILRCIQLLKDDLVSVAVFPEGGIKEKDKLNPFRSGVFKIAQKAQVPIVVCTLKGTSDLFHNIKRLKKTRVDLHLVDVIPAEDLAGRTTVEIAERVHRMMLEDLGPDYAL